MVGLYALAYSILFLALPTTAMWLGNQSWSMPLNFVGFFCFIGGWAVVRHMFEYDRGKLGRYGIEVLLFEIFILILFPQARTFAFAEPGQYLTLCAVFFGPLIASLYILALVFRRRKATAT